MLPTGDQLGRAIKAAREGRRVEARDMLLQVVDADPQNESAWIWLTGLVDDLEDKIIACENVLTINPSNERVRAYLNQLLQKKAGEQPASPQSAAPDLARTVTPPPARPAVARPPVQADNLDPRSQARQYEAEGRLEEARLVLLELASVTKDSHAFDQIYKEITRLEGLQDENIAHVSPALSIARLAAGWPLLYLSLALIQSGLNPIAHPAWYLWLGLPIVTVGGFLLAFTEVRSRNPFWRAVFAEENAAGSEMARMSAYIGGWMLVILPHLLMFTDAVNRLAVFQVPPIPF